MRRILDFCQREQEWLMETLETLVRLESPSTDKQAVDRCGAELARRLRGIGARVSRIACSEAGDHLRAEFGAADGDQVLLLTHFDTVWPIGQVTRMPLRYDAGRLYGPGVYDMKGGIAIALLAVRAAFGHDTPPRRVVLLATTDEEIGSGTSRSVIEEEARRSRAVFVLEPSMPDTGALKTARKGSATFELRTHGVAAHAGEPEKGVSALLELADQLLAIESLPERPPDATITACLAGAGARANVVPEQAWALLDVRMTRLSDADAIAGALDGLAPRRPHARVTVSGRLDRPPLERTPAVLRLYQMARDVGAGIGLDLEEAMSGGVSDGNFTAALGVPTLDGLGAVGAGAHALDEHVEIAALAPRAALLAGLLVRFPYA